MLDQYSSAQLSKLAGIQPDWLPYFSECPYEDSTESYLLVRIASVGDPAQLLFLHTADEEVTIAFGVWECHFSERQYWEQGELLAALAEIDRIQKDEHVIVSFWHEAQWLGSRVVAAKEATLVPDFVSGANRARVLSWSGALSREIELT